jgi:hypothetical protein
MSLTQIPVNALLRSAAESIRAVTSSTPSGAAIQIAARPE